MTAKPKTWRRALWAAFVCVSVIGLLWMAGCTRREGQLRIHTMMFPVIEIHGAGVSRHLVINGRLYRHVQGGRGWYVKSASLPVIAFVALRENYTEQLHVGMTDSGKVFDIPLSSTSFGSPYGDPDSDNIEGLDGDILTLSHQAKSYDGSFLKTVSRFDLATRELIQVVTYFIGVSQV